MLFVNRSKDILIQYLAENIDVVAFGDRFTMLVLELTRRFCRRDPHWKSRLGRVLFWMLLSVNAAVFSTMYHIK